MIERGRMAFFEFEQNVRIDCLVIITRITGILSRQGFPPLQDSGNSIKSELQPGQFTQIIWRSRPFTPYSVGQLNVLRHISSEAPAFQSSL